MKITAFILLACCLQLSAKTKAQEQITLKEKGASLLKIFSEIQRQSGYNFFFSEELLKDSRPVDIEVKSASIKEVLDICFRNQPFTYSITKNIITIIPKQNKKIDEGRSAQETGIDVNGRVVDKDGNAVAGATVSIQGTDKSVVTNLKGEFTIKDINENSVLIVTNVGYEDVKIYVRGRNTLNAVLTTKMVSMDEVQVIGYGTTTKRLNTGNVGTIKSKDIQKQPVNNPLLAMQGRMTGVDIQQSTGLPGTGVTIQIRGQNSINNGNNPLFIIDGVPYTAEKLPDVSVGLLGYSNETAGNPFSYINPADIESIDVLKDADATAIYGTRGANGVILITTKKGKEGQIRFDVNMQTGFGKVAKKMDLLNTRQYLDMRYEAFKNDNATPDPNADYDLTLWDTTSYTNWQKELIGGTARFNDIQTAVYGGSANTQYRIGAGFHKETTVFPGDFHDQKGSAQFNINSSSANKKFRVMLSGVYTTDNNRLSGSDFTERALMLPPVAPAVYSSDGSINWALNAAGVSTWPGSNPGARQLNTYQTKTNNLVANANLGYKLFTGFEIKVSLGYTNMQTNDVSTVPLMSQEPASWSTVQRRARFANNNIQSWIIEPQATYSHKIANGLLSVLIGTTIQQNRNSGEVLAASGFNSDLVLEDIRSATNVSVASSIKSIYKYNALFGRVNYNLFDKYLVNVTARRDGTSRFGPENRFHNFGAIGLGWVFSRELLVQQVSALSFGKLRASYGTTGSDQVGDYTFMDLYSPISEVNPYQGAMGTRPDRIFTPDLAWEETRKLEAGLELGFWNDRLLASASFYQNRSTNQLTSYTLPSITGFTTVTRNLDALVQNKGWEFELRSVNINKEDFRWSSGFNITFNRNKLLSAANGVNDDLKRKVGYPLGSKVVYRYTGVNIITGLYEVTDVHGNPTSTPDPATDATQLIDLNPKYYGGLQNEFSYKGLQLDLLLQFVQKPNGYLYDFNYIPGFFNGFFGSNQPVSVLDRWQQPGDVRNIQRFSQNSGTLKARQNALDSDRAYGDVSFVRLKNASLSWFLPANWKQKIHVHNARIYVQGQNLFTFTPYNGLDPETNSYLRLPPLRVVTAGIQVTL